MATRYWVGGAGTWNTSSTTNWATSSGGSSGASVPTSADDVIIDTSSGTGSITLSSAICNSLTVTASQALVLGAGASALSISGSLSTPSGGSFSINSSVTITFAATTTGKTITSNGKTLPNITFNGTGGGWQLLDALTSISTSTLTLTAGALDLNNFTATIGLFSSSSSNARSIAFGTSGQISLTASSQGIWNCALATNFTYTGTAKIVSTYAGASGTRTMSFGTMAVPFTVGAGTSNQFSFGTTATDSLAFSGSIASLDFTGFTGTWTQGGTALSITSGNLTLSSGMTYTASAGVISFTATSGTQSITSAGKTINPITINGVGGTVQLQDALTLASSATLTLTNGTFNANNFNVTTGLFSSNNSNTRTITMGSGTWTLSGTGNIWATNTTTGLTFNKNTANIVLSDVSTTARTFAGGGLTYNNLTIGGSTGISTLTITGANTFDTLASTKTVAHTIVFPNSTTTVNNFTITGTVGNVVTLSRTGASGTWTISKSSGGIISGLNYLSISNSTASPISTWYAGANSTDGGGNTNWIFTAILTINSGFFFFM
jgi:hypothetical protein